MAEQQNEHRQSEEEEDISSDLDTIAASSCSHEEERKEFIDTFISPPSPSSLPSSPYISFLPFQTNNSSPPYGAVVTLSYPEEEEHSHLLDDLLDQLQHSSLDIKILQDTLLQNYSSSSSSSSSSSCPPPAAATAAPHALPPHLFHHHLYLKYLYKYSSLIVLKGEQSVTPINQIKLLRSLQEKISLDSQVNTEEYRPGRYEELLSEIEALKISNFHLTNELNDTKISLSHLQDEMKLEKSKNLSMKEQLTSFTELEEYSHGLRDECSKLEEVIVELKSKLNDMEKNYTTVNNLNHDLQNDKMKFLKDIHEKDLKIESLEKELWSRHLKGNSPLTSIQGAKVLNLNGVVKSLTFERSASESESSSPQQSPRVLSPRQPSLPPSPKQSSPKVELSPRLPPSGTPISPGDVTSDLPPPTTLFPTEDQVTEDPQSNISPNLTRMIQEMEESNQRLVSRLKFLDSRLEIKEGAIRKLNARLEEVSTERDSFREAMKELLVDMNTPPPVMERQSNLGNQPEDGNTSSPPSRKKKSSDISSNTSQSSSENPNWQSAVSVVGSFLTGPATIGTKNGGNDTNAATLAAALSAAAASQQTIQTLEYEIQRLKKYNFEIQKQEIENLKLINEELEKSLEVANQATHDAEKWADNEFHILENKVNETIKEKNEVYEKLELTKIEMERLQKQIQRQTMKSTTYEEKIGTLNQRIDSLDRELKETKAKAINPEEFTSLQNRVQELMGESKHWQQKAMSLSKEMQRSMSIQMELNRIQQEMATARARMEELEAERTAFRDAMQQAISASSNVQSENLSAGSETPQSGWLRKIL